MVTFEGLKVIFVRKINSLFLYFTLTAVRITVRKLGHELLGVCYPALWPDCMLWCKRFHLLFIFYIK